MECCSTNYLSLFITQYLQWRNRYVRLNAKRVLELPQTPPREMLSAAYHQVNLSYPKFFKMDLLSKLAVLSFDFLSREAEINETWHTGLVISTLNGCLDVDLQFEQSRLSLPSPSLFVYTLPNIMLGEIAIRHGIKGEQCCLIAEPSDVATLHFYAEDLIRNQQMHSVFCGHIDATETGLNATLLRLDKNRRGIGTAFEESALLQLLTEPF